MTVKALQEYTKARTKARDAGMGEFTHNGITYKAVVGADEYIKRYVRKTKPDAKCKSGMRYEECTKKKNQKECHCKPKPKKK